MSWHIDMMGRRYGRLVVIAPDKRNKHGSFRWLCQCDCGQQSVVDGSELRKGKTTSCGCKRRDNTIVGAHFWKHGMSRTLIYIVWRNMHDRCNNKKSAQYHNYGGRGIRVCSRWEDFINFFNDMGERPEGLTLDRIDNSKGYFPDNCRWADNATQQRNKRNNKIITYKGVTCCMAEMAERVGVNYGILNDRLRKGWSVEDAIETPKRGKRSS